jgi:type VI secretion system secreted protein VgrG
MQVASLVRGGGDDGDHLAPARFRFTAQGAPETAWQVVRFELAEELSQPYEATITLAAEQLHEPPEAMLGRNAQLVLDRAMPDAPAARRIGGVIRRVERLALHRDHHVVRVVLVPALWTLTHVVDSRIFQDQTAREIVATLLREHLPARDRTFRDDCQRIPARREYCVQYGESVFAFVSRLLEEEAIHYHFEPPASDRAHEVLVLTDANEAFRSLDGGASRVAVEFVAAHGGVSHVEAIHRFDDARELQPTSVTLGGYNWTHPDRTLRETQSGQDPTGASREQYLAPGVLSVYEYDPGAFVYTRDDAGPQAAMRRSELAGRGRRLTGDADVMRFAPGRTLDLHGHADSGLDGAYVLTRVVHRGEAPEVLHEHEDERDPTHRSRYRCEFDCAPFEPLTLRPARRTPKPRIASVQTATVVGPAGEEIHTDHHGRIKVQFHWDRRGQRDEHSSCYLRVQQAWAGASWGFVFLPRIGMEAVVQFVDGDPDMPLVTGTVYNGTHPVPYDLPAQRTRSTIKTNSSPGGGGFNELRFEDAAGSEEIFVHGQKDWNTVINHDRSTHVGNDESKDVGHDQTEHVGHDQTETVDHDRTRTVHGKETVTVDQDQTATIHQNRTEIVDGDHKETIHGNVIEHVDRSVSVTIGGGESVGITGAQSVGIGTAAPGGRLPNGIRMVAIGSGDSLEVTGNKADHVTRRWTLTGDQILKLTQGNATVTLKDHHVDIEAADRIQLKSPSGTIDLAADGSAISVAAQTEFRVAVGAVTFVMNAEGITLTGPTVQMTGAAGAVKADGQGATVQGTNIGIAGRTLVEITGGSVKLN